MERCTLAIVVAIVVYSARAWAGGNEALATQLDRDAIYKDYLATRFAEAEKKLHQALAACGGTACSRALRAKIHIDLGIVYGEGLKRPAQAKAEFQAALRDDPAQTLPSDFATDDLAALFAAAGGSPSRDRSSVDVASGSARGRSREEDLVHVPPSEQRIMTAVPLYAEVGAGLAAAKVQVRYSPFGTSSWKTVDMKPIGSGYGAEIPCLDVGTTTGDLRYFIQVVDLHGDVVAFSGTRNAPNAVAIKHDLAGPPPHLPGHDPPASCRAPEDCPPNLPGCKAEKRARREHGDKTEGASCADDRECAGDLACKVGACRARELEGACESDGDCTNGDRCRAGACVAPPRSTWLSVAIQQDVLFVPRGSDVCAAQSDYACFAEDGAPYRAGQPYAPELGRDDAVGGGPALATTRVLLGIDRVLADNFSAGARLGYAFGGAPARLDGPRFFAFHFEVRASYWIGSRPFETSVVRPYVTLGGGKTQVDAEKTVTLHNLDPQPNGRALPSDARDQSLSAWRKTGTTFVAAGGGALVSLSRRTALSAELRAAQLFGTPGTALGVQIGIALGL